MAYEREKSVRPVGQPSIKYYFYPRQVAGDRDPVEADSTGKRAGDPARSPRESPSP